MEDQFTISQEDKEIMWYQNELNKLGWQWEERIYNDVDLDANCSVSMTKSTDPCYLTDNVLGDTGWGRFSRHRVWEMAYEALSKEVEDGN